MTIAFDRMLGHQPQFRASAAWLHELGTSDARGAEVLIDYTSECTVIQEVETYEPSDDSGQKVNHMETPSKVRVEMKFLGSDEKIRSMFFGTGDNAVRKKYFGLTLQLADYVDDDGTVKTGYYTFYKGKISVAGNWTFGANGHGFMLVFHALPNKTCAAYTATLPTGTCFKPTAASAGIGTDEFYYTADGAIV